MMLPGLLLDSKGIINYIYKSFGNSVYVSIMNQYTPSFNSNAYPEINKTLSSKSYEALINYSLKLGIENGFIQEEGTCLESFIPDFDLRGI